ncbi:MAG: HDOD domain-containing protein [Desulfobacterales bacterium]
MTRKDIQRQISERIVQFPIVDRCVGELMAVLNRPGSNFSQIVDRLSPEVAARFLDMANSANPGREVRSLSYAVQLLGYGHMKKILISAILMEPFTRQLPAFDFKRFQTQSLFCGVIARVIGRIIDYERPEDLFTAGVLHNIGKQMIAIHFPEQHQEILDLKHRERLETGKAEEQVLGITHAEVGAIVLKRFNIPDAICEAVRLHNADIRALPPYPEGEFSRVVHVASRVVHRYALPDAFPTLSLERRMGPDIEIRKEEHRQAVADAMRNQGYHRVFPKLLRQIADGLMIDLKKQFRLREEAD